MTYAEVSTSLFTILRKEINRVLRIWPQTLLPPVITTALYFIIFGRFIGSQVADINGFTYIQFIVPGLIMMTIITSSYSNVVSSFYIAKFQKSIEELLVSPTPNIVIIFGYCLGGVVRGLLVGILVTILSLFFTTLTIHNIFFVLLFALLTSIMFSFAGLINAIYANSFDQVSIIPTFVLTPLTYLGGIFYSITLLPSLWQNISKANPILYMVNGFRYGFLGITDINIWIAFTMLILFISVLFTWAYLLIKKGHGIKS